MARPKYGVARRRASDGSSAGSAAAYFASGAASSASCASASSSIWHHLPQLLEEVLGEDIPRTSKRRPIGWPRDADRGV